MRLYLEFSLLYFLARFVGEAWSDAGGGWPLPLDPWYLVLVVAIGGAALLARMRQETRPSNGLLTLHAFGLAALAIGLRVVEHGGPLGATGVDELVRAFTPPPDYAPTAAEQFIQTQTVEAISGMALSRLAFAMASVFALARLFLQAALADVGADAEMFRRDRNAARRMVATLDMVDTPRSARKALGGRAGGLR